MSKEKKIKHKVYDSPLKYRERFIKRGYHFVEEKHPSYTYFLIYSAKGEIVNSYNVIDKCEFILGSDIIVQSRKYLIDNDITVKQYPEYNKFLYKDCDLDSLQLQVGKRIVGIDIKNCYFETARRLGFLSDKVYEKAITNRAGFKDAMNFTVGSFRGKIILTEYNKGKVIKEPYLLDKCIRLKNYNLAVVEEAQTICWNIRKMIGSDLLMWLTDCFYMPDNKESIKKVQQYLTGLGYSHRLFKTDLESVNQITKVRFKVNTYDFKDVKPKEYNFNKYYCGFQENNYLTK